MKIKPVTLLLLYTSLFSVLEGCQTKNKENKDIIPVLVFTDFGRDVDDAEAFVYLAKNPDIKIAGVVCNSYIPQIRAESLALFLSLMDCKPPIAIGSTFPMGIKDSALIEQYFFEHSLNGSPYEITLKDSLEQLVNHSYEFAFETPESLISTLLEEYSTELRIVILSQATDVATYFSLHPEKIKDIHSFYIQGQAIIDPSNKLIPDFAAYNLREDVEATEFLFSLQEQIPFTLLGKYTAYPMAYSREEISAIARENGKVGKYINDAANMGLECFLKRDSATFYRIFNIDESIEMKNAFQYMDKISNPYDLLTVMAIDRPELFYIDKSGKHSLIGMSPHQPAFRDSLKVKSLLLKLAE